MQSSNTMPINPAVRPGNNLWFGDNYSPGMPQASRGQVQQFGGLPYFGMTPPVQEQAPQTMNNIIQAMSPESADELRVGPNSHVIIMDSNRPVFYMKDSDDTGHAKTRAFAFHEIPLYPEQEQQPQPLTREDVVAIVNAAMEERMANNA